MNSISEWISFQEKPFENKSDLLCLPEPFGLGSSSGIHISITCSSEPDFDLLNDQLYQAGCHEVTRKRVLNCIKYSKRYDCIITSDAWRRGELVRDMKTIGVDIKAIKDYRLQHRWITDATLFRL